MRCPRCQTENGETAERCARCGAPLLLKVESTPGPLDRPIRLDRRTPPASPAPPARPPPAARPPPLPVPQARREPPAGGIPRPVVSPREPGRAGPPGAPAAGPSQRQPATARGAEVEPEVKVEAIEIHLRRPRPWKRAAAWLVDGLVVAIFGAAILWLALSTGGPRPPIHGATGPDWLLEVAAGETPLILSLLAIMLVAAFVHSTLGHALMGATLGKRLLGLRLVSRDGRPPPLARCAVRAGLGVLSFLLLGLGCLLALFTRTGRSLHDLLTGTYVVEVP